MLSLLFRVATINRYRSKGKDFIRYSSFFYRKNWGARAKTLRIFWGQSENTKKEKTSAPYVSKCLFPT